MSTLWNSFLLDVDTSRVLIWSHDCGALNLLHSHDGNTIVRSCYDDIKVDNKFLAKELFATSDPHKWIEYLFDQDAPRHRPDHPQIDPGLRARAKLTHVKLRFLNFVNNSVDRSRRAIQLPALYSETVSMIRKNQAKDFRASAYDETRLGEFPFVWQYASVFSISPKVAADRIILEAEIWESELWKAEGLKLKYWNLVLESTDVDNLAVLAQSFKREFYFNAIV